jgi:hypothetical protein
MAKALNAFGNIFIGKVPSSFLFESLPGAAVQGVSPLQAWQSPVILTACAVLALKFGERGVSGVAVR